MDRRVLLSLCLCLAGCTGPSRPLESALPAEAGGWTRAEAAALAPDNAPQVVRSLGLKQAVTATYSGPAVIPVRVYEMNAPTSAFELIQKWRQQDGLAVYTGPFFIVADPPAGPEASQLLEALRKSMSGPGDQ